MKNPITKFSVAAVLIVSLIYFTFLPKQYALGQVIEAFNKATNIHIVKTEIITNGMKIKNNEAWIKDQTFFRAEAQDWSVIDNGDKVLTLYKDQKIAHLRNSFTPYWDYTPLILKVFRDNQAQAGITTTRLAQESTPTEQVYSINFKDRWKGKAWIDTVSNLPIMIIGSEMESSGSIREFEITFNYEPIPDNIFHIAIPAGYRELPRIENSDIFEEREAVLFGTVIDPQGNPIVNAKVFASYAEFGITDNNGEFILLAPPIDGSGSIGPADFPIYIWAFKDDLDKVGWTLIRDPEIEEGSDIEETYQGVKLIIENEEDLFINIPGVPGEFLDIDGDINVRDIVLVMEPAGVISGQVRGIEGQPLANTIIRVEELYMQLGANELIVSEFDQEWKSAPECVTDDQGYYTLTNIPDCWSKVYLSIYAPGLLFKNDDYKIVIKNGDWNIQIEENDLDEEYEIRDEQIINDDDEDEDEHFPDVIADGYPFRGGKDSVSETVPLHLRKNLMLYYSFYSLENQEMVRDISGNNFHGQVFAVNYAWDEILGGMMSFDGDNDYITLPSLLLETFTFSAWVKTTTDNLNNRRIFLLSDGERFFALQGNSIGSLGFCVDDGEEVNEEDWNLDRDIWTHITVTFDGYVSNIYKNGSLTETGNLEASGITGTFYIGGTDDHRGGFWEGLIDEVALFDRALTAEEVEQLFLMTGTYVK